MSKAPPQKQEDRSRPPPSEKSIADAIQDAIDLGIQADAETEAERKFFGKALTQDR